MMRFSLSELIEGLRIAFNALRTNKLRTILTTTGILIGIVVVTVIIAVIQGLNDYVSSEISGLGSDVVYVSRLPWMIRSYEEYLEYNKRRRMTDEHYKFVKEHSKLAEVVVPDVTSRASVKYKGAVLERVIIQGSSEDYIVSANVLPDYGRFYSKAEVELRRSVCVIGSEVAENLFGQKDDPLAEQTENVDPIGKRIKVGSQKYMVVGVLEERGNMFGFSLDNMIILPYTVFQKNFGARRDIDIQVKAKDPDKVDELVDELTGIMRRSRGLKAGQEDNFAINQQSQLMDIYNQMTGVLWIVLIGIGSIALLVGGIGIMNIMLVSVTERTREIGIRKSLGAKRRVIMWQFLVETICISGIGVTIGMLISVGIGMLIKSAANFPVSISTWIIFLGLGFTLSIGLFFGLYPASKAARLDPIEALRME